MNSLSENPANSIKDPMWDFLKDGGQQANVPALKSNVYKMIRMVTQKTGGQEKYGKSDNVPFESLEAVQAVIVMEAVALVVSGKLDELGPKNEV